MFNKNIKPKGPLVSVVVPCFNAKPLISRCVDSILKQSYKNIEIIFIDDCSNDGSYEYTKEKYGHLDNMIILQNKKNKGYVYNVNYAFKISKGEIFCNTNIDLFFQRDFIKEMMKIIKLKNIGLVGTQRYFESGKISLEDKSTLSTFTHLVVYSEEQNKKSKIKEIIAAGIFCLDKRRLKEKNIKKPFDGDYCMYCEDDYLGLLTWYAGLNNYKILKPLFGGMDSYTKRINPKFKKRAIYYGTRNLILNYLIFFDISTILKLTPYIILLSLGIIFKNPKYLLQKIKASLWLLLNIKKIIKKRKYIKEIKRRKDAELTSKFYSYKLYDNKATKSILLRKLSFINYLFLVYTKIVNLKTADNQNK